MKPGDLVRCRADKWPYPELDDTLRLGIIIDVEEFDPSGLWYHVKWPEESLWHVASDLELISESR
jgi:hypothetical protein